ncbi:MAG: chorismate mutase [archaeon]
MNLELETIREKITGVDNEILELLEERIALAEEVADVKKENDLPIEDLTKEEEIIRQRKLHTSLNGDFVEAIMKLIIKESKKVQSKVIDKEE